MPPGSSLGKAPRTRLFLVQSLCSDTALAWTLSRPLPGLDEPLVSVARVDLRRPWPRRFDCVDLILRFRCQVLATHHITTLKNRNPSTAQVQSCGRALRFLRSLRSILHSRPLGFDGHNTSVDPLIETCNPKTKTVTNY